MKIFIAKCLVGLLYALIFAGLAWIITQLIQIPPIPKQILIGTLGLLGFSIGYFYFKKALESLGDIVVEGIFRLIFKGLKMMISGVADSI